MVAHSRVGAVEKSSTGTRDLLGDYDLAFHLAAGLCFVAAALCAQVRKVQVSAPVG
jgi:hypothetical protein